jgi:hypothetical protein
MNWLNILGLLFGFIGTVILTMTQFMDKKQAIKLGLPYWAGNTDEENEKIPQVQQLLKQSRYAKIGFLFIALAFLLQLLAELFFKS